MKHQPNPPKSDKESEEHSELYQRDPNCDGKVRAKEMWEGGGVCCTKCRGWFCY